MKCLKNVPKFLLCVTEIEQLTFFSPVSSKIKVFTDIEKNLIPFKIKKKFDFLEENNLFQGPFFDFFISFKLSFLEKKTIFQIFKNSKLAKGVLFLWESSTPQSIFEILKSSKKKKTDFYFNFFFKILSKHKKKKGGLHSLKRVKIIPRNIFPAFNFGKFEKIARIWFSKKNKSFKGFQKFIIRLPYSKKEEKNGIAPDITKKSFFFILDDLQRELDENGLLVTRIKSWNLRDHLFFLFALT